MAWWTINHSCGHEQRVQLYGPGRDREKKAEWMERRVCPDCYRKEKENERKQENERAASVAGTIGFVSLSGSEKQVAWATTIRQKALESLLEKNGIKEKIVECFNHETSSKWWIDNRDKGAYATLELLTKLYN